MNIFRAYLKQYIISVYWAESLNQGAATTTAPNESILKAAHLIPLKENGSGGPETLGKHQPARCQYSFTAALPESRECFRLTINAIFLFFKYPWFIGSTGSGSDSTHLFTDPLLNTLLGIENLRNSPVLCSWSTNNPLPYFLFLFLFLCLF